jgi:hypothetical protein
MSELTGQQLAEVLSRHPELRQSGTKDVRIGTLWQSHLSEPSILNHLTGRDLEDILYHLGLRGAGAKAERVQRLIEHFKAAEPRSVSAGSGTETS